MMKITNLIEEKSNLAIKRIPTEKPPGNEVVQILLRAISPSYIIKSYLYRGANSCFYIFRQIIFNCPEETFKSNVN